MLAAASLNNLVSHQCHFSISTSPEEILYSGLKAPNERDEEKKGLTILGRPAFRQNGFEAFSGAHVEFLFASRAWYGMVWYGMVWYGMVWYGNFIYTSYFLQVHLHSSIEN